MPTLPVYQQEVRPNALRPTHLGADSFGATKGRQLEGLGNATSRTAGAFAEIQRRQQERADADAAFQAEVRMQQDWSEFSTSLRQREGNGAAGIYNEANGWWRAAQKRYEAGLTPEARQILAKSAARTRLSGTNQILAHQETQLERAHDLDWAASKQASISTALQNPTSENIAATIEDLRSKNAYQAARKHWGDDVLQLTNENDITNLHENVISALLNQPQGGIVAEEYFAKYKDQISGPKLDEIEKSIQNAAINDRAEMRAASLYDLPPAEALRQIQKIKDPKLRKAVKREWAADNQIKTQIRNEQERANSEAVWAIINEGGKPTEGQLRGLSQSERARVERYLEANATGQVSKLTGMVHADHDTLDDLERVERDIYNGSIRNRDDLNQEAPHLSEKAYLRMLDLIGKATAVSRTDLEREYTRRAGIPASKILTDKREQWGAFQSFVLNRIQETGSSAGLATFADEAFAAGYGRDNTFWRNDPDTRLESLAKGRKDWAVRTPEEEKPLLMESLKYARSIGGDSTFPSGKYEVDGFYTDHYLFGKHWLESRGEEVTPARMGAIAALRSQGRRVDEESINIVIGRLLAETGTHIANE